VCDTIYWRRNLTTFRKNLLPTFSHSEDKDSLFFKTVGEFLPDFFLEYALKTTSEIL